MGMYFVHQWHEDAEADALANRRSLTLDSMKSAWRRSGIWSNDAGWDLASSGDLTAEAFSATSSLAEALLAYRLGDVSRLELSERAAALACEAARSA